MAKKAMTLQFSVQDFARSIQLASRLENLRPVRWLSGLYSKLLEEHVSPRRTLRLVHAQVGLAALLILGGSSVVMAALLTAWTCLAMWQCKAE